MTANFKVTHASICPWDKNIVVFNYHYINEVQNISCDSDSKLTQDNSRIGIWKIKKLK